MPIIVIKNLSVNYGGYRALSDICFSVEKGDYISIVGENGSGKTTMIKTILGLIKPKMGSVTFNCIEENEIGYLAQYNAVQKSFPASVFEVVISGCLNKKRFLPIYSKKEKNTAKNNIKKLGISSLSKKSYIELSGGQRQKTVLARALCAAKEVLILDEPTNGLDPIASLDLYSIIKKLNKESSMTIIAVSHDIKNALKYSNKILHLDNKLIFFGSTPDYIKTDVYKKISGEPNNA